MLHIAIMLRSDSLHLVTSSQTALVIQHSLQPCYITVLRYISVLALSTEVSFPQGFCFHK